MILHPKIIKKDDQTEHVILSPKDYEELKKALSPDIVVEEEEITESTIPNGDVYNELL